MAFFRKCAGIVVFNADKKVLLCARNDSRSEQWQFPQGGIMKKEGLLDAALRELKEETSISSVKPVKTLDTGFRYEFPRSVKTKFQRRGIDTVGQEMYWSLLYFYGDEKEINLKTKQPEFKAWEWVEIDQALLRIVYFKKDVYQKAVEIFKPLIEDYAGSLTPNAR